MQSTIGTATRLVRGSDNIVNRLDMPPLPRRGRVVNRDSDASLQAADVYPVAGQRGAVIRLLVTLFEAFSLLRAISLLKDLKGTHVGRR